MLYIFVLSLRDENLFLQMTVISATLLRRNSPNAKIIIVVDEYTNLTLYPIEYGLLIDLDVEILVIPTGHSDCVLSSRFIKLSLPEIVNERFWYLDGDTLPLANLDVVNISCDIAMVRDLNRGQSSYALNKGRIANCEVMKWPVPLYPYYNSGVIFANKTSRVREVFNYAKEIWLTACERGVRCGDQLPLNIAIQKDHNINIVLLDDAYNAQIRAAPSLASTAKILHIFSGSIAKHDDTVLHTLIDGLRNDSILRVDVIDRLLSTRNPWVKGSREARLFLIRKVLLKFKS